jgi:hypothetical protein
MNTKEKKALLRTAKKLLFLCTEFTNPDVEFSNLNYQVAEIGLSIDELIKIIK